MVSLPEGIREVGRALLDFVYPPHCLGCGRAMGEVGEYLCGRCWEEILAPVPARCGRCSCPLETAAPGCANCASWESAFERAVVLGRFGGAMQPAIHALKFRQQRNLGQEFGRRMGGALGRVLQAVDLLVPVPLHPARERERGYNQSLCIARGLAEVLEIPVDSRLVKRRVNTRQQAKLDVPQRQANMRDSFGCAGPLPEHRCIGLVDDVLTTGATLDACARVLVRAGARQVWGLALASPFHGSASP